MQIFINDSWYEIINKSKNNRKIYRCNLVTLQLNLHPRASSHLKPI